LPYAKQGPKEKAKNGIYASPKISDLLRPKFQNAATSGALRCSPHTDLYRLTHSLKSLAMEANLAVTLDLCWDEERII